MQVVKVIRERMGFNPYKMALLLGKSIQSYQIFEKRTQKITIKDLLLLHKVSGLTANQFIELLNNTDNI